jgi:hypothetical protein
MERNSGGDKVHQACFSYRNKEGKKGVLVRKKAAQDIYCLLQARILH